MTEIGESSDLKDTCLRASDRWTCDYCQNLQEVEPVSEYLTLTIQRDGYVTHHSKVWRLCRSCLACAHLKGTMPFLSVEPFNSSASYYKDLALKLDLVYITSPHRNFFVDAEGNFYNPLEND